MQGGIYRIRNTVNEHCYIGSTSNFHRRWYFHQLGLTHGNHHSPYLQHAYNCHGVDAFIYEVLEIVEDASLLLSREQHWMDVEKPSYNYCPVAGTRRGAKLTLEQREKLRLRALNQSPETRAKIAEAQRNRSPEMVAEIAARRRGQRRNDSTKAAISARAKERWQDPVYKAKMREAFKNRRKK